MAKKTQTTLPSSMGGLMRFQEGAGGLQISPGQVVIFTLLLAGLMIVLKLLK